MNKHFFASFFFFFSFLLVRGHQCIVVIVIGRRLVDERGGYEIRHTGCAILMRLAPPLMRAIRDKIIFTCESTHSRASSPGTLEFEFEESSNPTTFCMLQHVLVYYETKLVLYSIS